MLGKGLLKTKIDIEVTASSGSAKTAVEKTGGTVKIVEVIKANKIITEKSEI